MTVLVPMSAEEFASFKVEAIAAHAEDSVKAGRWLESVALKRSQLEFRRLLPQGLDTPRHRLFEIRAIEGGAIVGHLWFATSEQDGSRAGFLYNIRVKPQYRGQGHAKNALDLVDRLAASEGLTSMALQVFAFNTGAQALYRSQGYWITGLNMRKQLRPDVA